MRCAVFSVTSNGIALAEKLIKGCPRHSFDVYVKEGREAGEGVFRYSTLKDAVAECFEKYDALIFFSAMFHRQENFLLLSTKMLQSFLNLQTTA